MVGCLAEILSLEKDLEVMKINLSLRSDFNLIEAFSLLDRNCQSSVTRTELRAALEDLHAYFSEDDLHLVFARYSHDG